MKRSQKRRAASPPKKRKSARPVGAGSRPLRQGIRQQLATAMQLHQAGDIGGAAEIYGRVLEKDPNHASALHFLGVAMAQRGNVEEGLAYLQRSIAAEPKSVQFLNNYSMMLRDCGRLEEAVEHFERMLELNPALPEGHNNLGTVLRRQGRFDAAIESFRKAIELRPDYAEAHGNLGNALVDRGRLDDAIAAHEQAVALNPGSPEIHNNLGNALKERGDCEEAAKALSKAVRLNPQFAEAHSNLGVALNRLGRHGEAVDAYQRALALNPAVAEFHTNLGNVYTDQGRFEESIACHDNALRLLPDYIDAHVNRAHPLLVLGRLQEGWNDYEQRLRKREAQRVPVTAPAWEGGALDGKTILVRAEQGIGDEILFASCFSDLVARAGHCVIECEPRLGNVFARSFPDATVRGSTRDDQSWLADVPAIDTHVMLASLMYHLRPNLESFPRHDGYLVADPAARDGFAKRLAALGPGLKVGISWRSMRGSRWHESYTSVDKWQGILTLPGVRFVNLQYDEPGPELAEINQCPDISVHDFADLDLLNDIDGVAALIAALDLVIAPTNTVAALCGALGKPVWLLTPEINWTMFGTGTYPWFPSAVVYRWDSGMPDWSRALECVAEDLAKLAENG